MAVLFAQVLVATTGLAHALASWQYFARISSRGCWIWPLAWAIGTLASLVLMQSAPLAGFTAFLALVAAWTIWWLAIRASTTLEWVAENRLQATGRIIGNEVAITNVRNFDWIDKRTFEEKWEARQYDIETLQAIDVFVSSWGNPRIAHIMVSFDFAGGPPLCVSVETRREAGERWSALAGFMKSYELIIIAGDERDLVRSRVNVRGEDVRLYRIYTTPEMRRKILAGTIAQMNRLSARPRFYNTIFHNCTIEIARIVWAAGHRFPFDWRLLVSGYVAEYLYDVGLLDRTLPFAGLKTSADITQRSRTADRAPDYSQRIRAGLRDPTRDIAVTASPVSPARPQVGARP